MMMKRRTFFVFLIIEPLRLGITIQINTCNVDKATRLTGGTIFVPVYMPTKNDRVGTPEEEARLQ